MVEHKPAAFVRSASRRAFEAPAELGLSMPTAEGLLKSEWKKEVTVAINKAELQALETHESLQWLVLLNPSLRWRRKFIIQKPHSDFGSLLIAGILVDRVFIVPDTRGAIMKPPRAGICDLCAQGCLHFDAGGRLGTFLACPALAVPRQQWLGDSRRLADSAGVAHWWDAQARQHPHTAHSFLSLAFGAVNPARAPARLGDAMTAAFVTAFAQHLPELQARLERRETTTSTDNNGAASTVHQHEAAGIGSAL